MPTDLAATPTAASQTVARPPRGETLRTGITLVEMVVVMLIIGVLAAAAVPRFHAATESFRADAAAKRIQVDLKAARQRAKTASRKQIVRFQPAEHRYLLPDVMALDRPGAVYTVELDEEPYGAAIAAADFGGDAEIHFDGYGMPDSDGEVVIRVGDNQRSVAIDAAAEVSIR